MPEIPRSQKRRHYIAAYLGNAALLISNLLILHISQRALGNEGFTVYAISRRNIGIITLFIVPALNVTLTRLTAKYDASQGGGSSALLALAQIFLSVCLFPLLLVCFTFPGEFTRLSFGSTDYQQLALPIILNVIGIAVLSLACASLNGRLKIVLSTVLSLLGMAILPLAIFLTQPTSAKDYFWTLGLTLIGYSMVANAVVFWVHRSQVHTELKAKILSKEFIKFALPRVPNSMGLNIFNTLPLILMAFQTDDPTVLAVIALSNYPITLSGLLVTPATTILLPEATLFAQQRRFRELQVQTRRIMLIIFGGMSLLILIISLAIKPLLNYGINPEIAKESHLLIWFIVAILPLSLVRVGSVVLDAVSERAYNTENTGLSVFALLAIYFALSDWDGVTAVLVSFVAASFFLAGLTLFRLHLLLISKSKPSAVGESSTDI